MRKVFVGIHELGYERMRLYLRSGTGASIYYLPEDKGIMIMEIGADQNNWRDVVTSLLHETQEAAMCRLGLAHCPAGALNHGTANCIFNLTHEQFDECCARTSDFIVTALPALSAAWKKWKADGKKKKVKK